MNRAVVVGPIVFTLVGASVGLCLAMLYRQEPLERAHVYLDDSTPLVLSGALTGNFLGWAVFAACARWPKCAQAASLASSTLLGAAITAPLGWIVGDVRVERLPCEGLAAGAAVGAAIGLALGMIQMLCDRRRPVDRPRD